jgi:hypothetical protein
MKVTKRDLDKAWELIEDCYVRGRTGGTSSFRSHLAEEIARLMAAVRRAAKP